MEYIFAGVKEAFRIIFTFDAQFLRIVFTSIRVSTSATLLSVLFGVPLGIFLAEKKFFGRDTLVVIINTLMSIPTVVVGLMLYSFLSRRGPLGEMGLLYTSAAMIIGQFVLILPIITGLTITAIQSLDGRVRKTIWSMGADYKQGLIMFLHEARYGILAAVVVGFGRAFSEIGISMMLGGNIRGYTRNITTAIALETSKGEFALGISLGVVLLAISLVINLIFTQLQKRAKYELL
ncbi:MAG: ABC transporter permease [Candidatus Omnitrophica bacterium]|nr:ABC transporter permease [Candidatus Omnitrophota bacterium]